MNQLLKAKQLYERLDKGILSGAEISDMPAGMSSDRDMDLRAKEGNEALFDSDVHNSKLIDLTRKLMSIDTKQYGVNKKTANKIAEYVERNEDTAITELKMEYGNRVVEYNQLLVASNQLQRHEFASDMDFERTRAFNYKKLVEFHNKLSFLYEIIMVLEDHRSYDEEDRPDKESKKFQEDFDFSYIHSFWNEGYPLGN